MALTLEERAQKARQVLFGKYDTLNALWMEAEKRITKQHIPQTVRYYYEDIYSSEQDPQPSWAIGLGLVKVKGEWRICHLETCLFGDEREDGTPITECSVEIRVKAAKHLGELQQRAVESAEKFIPAVDEAITTLSATLGITENDQDEHLRQLLAERAKLNGRPKK